MHSKPHLLPTLLACLLILLALTGCPPTPPCDEQIADPEPHQQIIRSDPFVQALGRDLVLLHVNLSPCFVDGLAHVTLRYQMPASFSAYQAVYADELYLAYAKDGELSLPFGRAEPAQLQAQTVLVYFKSRIRQIESDPRAAELLSRTEPDPLNPFNPLYDQAAVYRKDNRLDYSFFYNLVRGYTMSNNLEWQAFPEIGQAHRIIEEHLLVGELSGCSIGQGGMHAYTAASLHDAPDAPWFLTVALDCPQGWMDASVKLNADGSYEKLEIANRY
jgi:hypothetical protein